MFGCCCVARDDKDVIRGPCAGDQEDDAILVTAEPLPEVNGADAQARMDVGKTGRAKYEEGGCFGSVKMLGKLGLTCALKLVLGCTTGILSCLPDPEQPDPEPLAADEASTGRNAAVIEVAAVESGEATVTTDVSDVLATEATSSEAQALSAEDQQTDASQEKPTAETVATEDQQPDASNEELGAKAATNEDQQPDASQENPTAETVATEDQQPDASKEDLGAKAATNEDQQPDASKEESNANVAAEEVEAERGSVVAGVSLPVVEEDGGQQKGQVEQ